MPAPDTLSAIDQKKLAAEQAEFVRALMNEEPAPEGFESEHFAAAAHGLYLKRKRSVQSTWPEIEKLLGTQYDNEFRTFADVAPLPSTGGPAADGRLFVEHLEQRIPLPDELRLATLRYDLNHSRNGDGFDARRGFTIRLIRLCDERLYVIGFHVPRLGRRIIRIPLIRPRRR